ncbi:MAG: tcrY 1 [Frankiales bacterium]|nr:tcrY 1 [Frankiales bacterium]
MRDESDMSLIEGVRPIGAATPESGDSQPDSSLLTPTQGVGSRHPLRTDCSQPAHSLRPHTPLVLRSRLALVPLRVRLVAAVLVLASLALAVSAVLATSVLRGYLVGRVDDDLREAVQSTPVRNGGIFEGSRGNGGPGGPNPFNRFYTVITFADGSPPLTSRTRAADVPDLPPTSPTGRPYTVDAASGNGQWRVLSVELVNGAQLTLATPLSDVNDPVRRLLLIQGAVSVAVLVVLAGAAYAVVRGSLRPLREVEQTAVVIAGEHADPDHPGDLSRRVPRQDDRTEVGRLATAFNTMLASIEGSLTARQESEAKARESEARMRRFIGDASHELRTPLTSIRGFAELYRAGAVPPGPDLDRAMGRVEGEAERMGRLVEELLLLARLDQQRPLETQPVDLAVLAADAVHDARALDETREISLQTVPAVVRGDEARLRQVLVNLLGNALAHTPKGTPVAVRLTTRDGRALLEVADEGPGLTPEQAARVFERFYRADTSRQRTDGLSGSGLGLSIVAAVAQAHRGTAAVRSAPGAGATFTLELPLA